MCIDLKRQRPLVPFTVGPEVTFLVPCLGDSKCRGSPQARHHCAATSTSAWSYQRREPGEEGLREGKRQI